MSVQVTYSDEAFDAVERVIAAARQLSHFAHSGHTLIGPRADGTRGQFVPADRCNRVACADLPIALQYYDSVGL